MHRQHFSGFFRLVVGTFRPKYTTLQDKRNPDEGSGDGNDSAHPLAPVAQVEMAESQYCRAVQPFGDAVELYRRAVSAAYLTALSFDKLDRGLPDDNLDGRDPRW
jgi:hypothetical protein